MQISVLLVLAVFASLLVYTAIRYAAPGGDSIAESVGIKGSYSFDGGDFKEYTNPEQLNGGSAKELVVKGKLSNIPAGNQELIIPSQNAWVEVSSGGRKIASNNHDSRPWAGYTILNVPSAMIADDGSIELKITNNYPMYRPSVFENTLSDMIVGTDGALYQDLLHNHTLEILVGLTICFLGLFGFGYAGVLFREGAYRYLTFAFVAFSGGYYVLSDSIFKYLPLWVNNPILCEVIDIASMFLLLIAGCVYLRACFENKYARMFMNILTVATAVAIVAAVVSHICGLIGFTVCELFVYPEMIALSVVGTIFLLLEALKWKNQNARFVLISMTPVIIASALETVNIYLMLFPGRNIMRIGMLLTVLLQLTSLVFATKKHYDEMLKIQEMQTELLQARVSIMVSQIQPHFMYNSLTSIAMLCEKDPKTAKKATIEFAEYLRGNMNSLKEKNPVPFETELKHLKTYLSLEKMRFGEDLNIVYDIQTTEFVIPLLSVQPLVENAVKHGVGMLEDGGTVTIATREYDDRFEVTVTDNGVGFDVNRSFNDGRSHVGIENCKSRLDSMCHGTLLIESEKGKGTKSTITIPKEEE